jgi:hypothetical protein
MTATLVPVHDVAGIEEAIPAEARDPGAGLTSHPDVIIAAATRHRLPLMGYARAGGLIDYSFNPIDMVAQAASYIDRILRGANPADLPV